jgi:hypothetical protein
MPTTVEKIGWRHSNDEKVDILQQYTNWMAAGKPYGQSPSTALAAKYNCHYNYPKQLFDKVLECGTISNGKSPGRPAEYTPDIWAKMIAIIEEFQNVHSMRPTYQDIQAGLDAEGCKVPGRTAIRAAKIKAGFRVKEKSRKPILTKVAMAKRFDFAKKRYNQCFKRWVICDMKWFNEGDPRRAMEYEERPDHPLSPSKKHAPRKAETTTQEVKLMYFCAVSGEHRIGLWEMKKEDWTKIPNAKGLPAKGITAEYCKPFFKKMHEAARQKLGHGFIGIWLDNATVHKACAKFLADGLFDEVVFQPPSSPDTNHCDAGVFVNMGQKVHKRRPKTLGAIRVAVAEAWEEIGSRHLRKVSDRVRANMKVIKSLKGGNFYTEGGI